MGTLEGMVAFITGAARGQGRSHAVRLAEEGASIIAVDLCAPIESVEYPLATLSDLAETVKVVEERGGEITSGVADVRDHAALQAVFDDGLSRFGKVDIVVANAGILPVIGAGGRSLAAWTDAIDVMLTGVFNTVDVTAPTLLSQGTGGSIVITSSTAGLKGSISKSPETATPGMVGYIAAKHGVVGLMRSYANAFAAYNIRVNTVHPAGCNTPMIGNESFGAWIAENPDMADNFKNPLPVEMVEPIDISNAIAWLCSDQARYVTGVTLPVDAGFTAR